MVYPESQHIYIDANRVEVLKLHLIYLDRNKFDEKNYIFGSNDDHHDMSINVV